MQGRDVVVGDHGDLAVNGNAGSVQDEKMNKLRRDGVC